MFHFQYWSFAHVLFYFDSQFSFVPALFFYFDLMCYEPAHKQQHETKSDARVFGYIVSKYQDENSSQQSKMSQPQMTFTPNLSGVGNAQRLLHSNQQQRGRTHPGLRTSHIPSQTHTPETAVIIGP